MVVVRRTTGQHRLAHQPGRRKPAAPAHQQVAVGHRRECVSRWQWGIGECVNRCSASASRQQLLGIRERECNLQEAPVAHRAPDTAKGQTIQIMEPADGR